MFALALQSKGKATLVGSLTGGDRTLVDIVPLPDGSGYVLPIGEYQVNVTNTKVVMADKTEEVR
jgi:C-terminal processing protease CtpA/Prc